MKARILTLIVIILFIFSSCEKETDDQVKKESPNDVILTVNVEDISTFRFFIIISNYDNDSKCIEVESNTSYSITRGDDFSGSKINLHILRYQEGSLRDWYINSYYDLNEGYTFDFNYIDNFNTDFKSIKEEENTNSKAVGWVDLSFENIPDFDIVTRSQFGIGDCSTKTEWGEVDNFSYGISDLYENDNKFYACFQDINGGKYALLDIPFEYEYTVSFSNLNSDMVLYNFNKSYSNRELLYLSLMSNNIGLFKMNNPDIFDGNIKVYVPNLEDLSSYYTRVVFDDEKENYTTVIETHGNIPNDFTFNDMDFNVSITNGMPVIGYVTGDYRYISGGVTYENCVWKIYSKSKDIPFPMLPDNLENELKLSDVTNSLQFFHIEQVEYENSDKNYTDFINDIINKSDDYTELKRTRTYKYSQSPAK